MQETYPRAFNQHIYKDRVMSKHEEIEYSVGIIGHGFVGTALHFLFPEAIVYDKYIEEFEDNLHAFEQSIVFICVPTDQAPDGSAFLGEVCESIRLVSPYSIAVIKSTIPPDCVKEFEDPIVFNPEFLTEKNWKFDSENETRIILGGDLNNCKKVARLYQKVYGQNVSYVYCTGQEAMMTKYIGNAFLASKVAFFNEMYDFCEGLGLDYDKIREMVVLDSRIGKTHTLVTEKRGFGGYCFPKDTRALQFMAKKIGVTLQVLNAVIAYNDYIRGKHGA